MYETEIPSPVGRPRVTVAAIVERDGRYLVVEERDNQGMIVLNQPAGHVEGGETLTEALVREAFEETGWHVRPLHLVGIYLWSHPGRGITYLRVAIAAEAEAHDAGSPLDAGIVRAVWLTPDELAACREQHRSPLVIRCMEDARRGERYPLDLLKALRA